MGKGRRGEEPLLLVHGFMDTWYTPWWSKFKEYLTNMGYSEDEIHQTTVGSIPGTTTGSPKKYAREIGDRVEEISEKHNSEVDIIAHSKGGLDTRWYAEKMGGDAYIDDLVTLSTPHRGTIPTYLFYLTPGGKDMAPNSEFMEELNKDGLSDRMEYTAIWSSVDPAVIPRSRARFPERFTGKNARNINAGAWGHLELVWRRPVLSKYVGYL